jgi:hypothetical protein
MTSGELPYKDVAGNRRPAGTDQRDAGAFQSISSGVNTFYIGSTSSEGFAPNYASVALWLRDDYEYSNVLNGETNALVLRDNETHALGSRDFNFNSGNQNVNQSFVISGHLPHSGTWDSGTYVALDGFGTTVQMESGNNSYDITFKDFIVDFPASATIFGYLARSRATISESHSPIHNYYCENLMVRNNHNTGILRFILARNRSTVKDADGNILEKGEYRINHKNCVFIGNEPNGINQAGIVRMGEHIGDTNAIGHFELIGCTIINSQMLNDRNTANSPIRLEGCLVYNDPDTLNPQSQRKPMGVFSNSPIAASLIPTPDKIVLKDSILNGPADSSVFDRSYQDRNSIWIKEPLASEWRDNTSGEAINNAYWENWEEAASSITIRTPFVFGEKAASGEVSLRPKSLSSIEPFQQGEGSLGIDYAVNSDLPLYDIAGILRDSDPNAGAYEGFFKFDTLVAFGNVYINLY